VDLQKYISKISNKMRMTRGESGEMEQSSRFIRLTMEETMPISAEGKLWVRVATDTALFPLSTVSVDLAM